MIEMFQRFLKYANWLYLQYLLITAQYVMEPFERKIFNTVLLIVIVLSVYSTYLFLPAQMNRILNWMNESITNYEQI